MSPVVLVLIVSAVIFGPLTAWLASGRDRSPGVWFVLGALAGPIATAIVMTAPPGRCPACGRGVAGWPTACPACGRSFVGGGRSMATGAAAAGGATTARRRPPAAQPPANQPPAAQQPVPRIESRSTAPTAIAVSGGIPAAPAAPPPAAPPAAATTGAGKKTGSKGRVGSRLRSSRAQKATAGTQIQDSGEATELLATAMYITGSHDCEPGLHYLLTIRGSALVVLGPLETAPHTVASSRAVVDLRVTAFGDGLLITDPRGIRGWSLGFQRFTGGSPEGVERALLAAGAGPGVE